MAQLFLFIWLFLFSPTFETLPVLFGKENGLPKNKWVAELRFGKCREAYFFKGL